jgi:hypothetical protein
MHKHLLAFFEEKQLFPTLGECLTWENVNYLIKYLNLY